MTIAAQPAALIYWLEGGDGRVQIRSSGLLVGRAPDCEIVINDPRVSRHQLLLRATGSGVEAVLLGKASVSVDGAAMSTHATLSTDSTISLCGRHFRVVTSPAPSAAAPPTLWAIEARSAQLHRITRSPFTVGGGVDDDLHFASWPPAALTFNVVQRALVLEVACPGAWSDGPLDAGAVVTLKAGATVRLLGQSLRALPVPGEGLALTEPEDGEALPQRVVLEFLPKGGRVTVDYGTWERTAWLADRRCDLIATLLAPPAPFAPGDAVPDAALIPRVWPGGQQGRVELNTLIFRARRDLVRADLDGGTLIARAEGSVRFRVAHGASITVRSS